MSCLAPVPVLAHNDDGGNDLSREAARLLAMLMAGIQPVDIIRNASGVQYVYDMNGRYMLVTENAMDRSYLGQPH